MKKTAAMTGRKRPSFQGAVRPLQDYVAQVAGPLRALTRLIFLPLRLLAGVLRFLDRLGQAIARGVVLLCSGGLALAMLAAVLFGLARILLHPWFV